MRALEPQKGKISPMSRKQWGHGNIYLRGKTWWIYYGDHGLMKRESSRSQKRSTAEDLLKKRLATVARGDDVNSANVLVDELLDDLLSDYRVNGKSIAWAQIVVNHLRPHFGRYRASKVGTAVVQSYIEERKKKDIANGTINRELSLLRSSFYMALRSEPPKISRVPLIVKLKEAPARKGFFEIEDFQAISKHLPEDIRDVAQFARQTGCRRSEILAIRWPQVDFKNRMVRLEAGETKNDEQRVLPMTNSVYELLWRRKEERDGKWNTSPWVFSRAGERIKSFKASWEVACKNAGIAMDAARLFHDLRRTGVRNMIRAGVPEKVAMMISGHKTRSVFDRYHIVDQRDLREAARKLDRLDEQEASL